MNEELLAIVRTALAACVEGATGAATCKRANNPAWQRIELVLDEFSDDLRDLEAALTHRPVIPPDRSTAC